MIIQHTDINVAKTMIDSDLMKKAQAIANKARKSISKFCSEECNAYCCRKGYLVLTKKEMSKTTQGKQIELEKKQILKMLSNGSYSLFMGGTNEPCPALKEFKCIIHKSKNRSNACRNFPIFIDGGYIKLSPRCLAVKHGLMYPYIKQWISLGFKILESDIYADIELSNLEIFKK
ncbi:MAG: YkgJ family cysteine cluster protein [Candidatus Woesearchaeota archaeon]